MGSSSKRVTVGYKYYLDVHAAICHGPVDAVTELVVGERTAWTGNVTASSTITVNAPELFGGQKREGGVAGPVDIMMGEPGQAINSRLVQLHGPDVPAYRGLLTTLFRNFYWSAMNPYFKAPWWRIRRILQGWSTPVWYSSKAVINTHDMNPAHIIYQCLTDINWGMGYSTSDIDTASFTVAADALHAEGFGLSIKWHEQAEIQEFVGIILDHINGTLRLDLTTGRFQLKLIRDDYAIEDLVELNPSNIIELSSFQRVAWGDTANEITVRYRDRNGKTAAVTVQDPAAIEAQGAIISATRDYLGIRESTLAIRVAMRDLNTVSAPLAKVRLVCNRVAWGWAEGDVFSLVWPRLGLTGVPMRVVSIDKGNLTEGKIEIEAVEDIFGLPTAAYAASPPSQWVDPISAPADAIAPIAVEVPYWDIARTLSAADIAYLEPGYGYGQVLAIKPSYDAYNFTLMSSPSVGGVYSEVGTGDFSAGGTIASAIGLPDGTVNWAVTLNNPIDLDQIDVGGYGYIDNEAFEVVSVNTSTSQLVLRRGVLDTAPAAHLAGARFYYASAGFTGDDPTERVSGESVYYKLLTQTGYGVLPLASATAVSLTLANRASRPYPPGQFKINGSYWPTGPIESSTLTISWAHRDRLQQTVDLVDYTEGNIGPEAGTTYTITVTRLSDSAVLASTSGVTGTSAVLTPTGDGLVRVSLQAIRDGLASRAQIHDFMYYRGELRLTEDGEGRITEAGEERILE